MWTEVPASMFFQNYLLIVLNKNGYKTAKKKYLLYARTIP
jgi:hypothetical protein